MPIWSWGSIFTDLWHFESPISIWKHSRVGLMMLGLSKMSVKITHLFTYPSLPHRQGNNIQTSSTEAGACQQQKSDIPETSGQLYCEWWPCRTHQVLRWPTQLDVLAAKSQVGTSEGDFVWFRPFCPVWNVSMMILFKNNFPQTHIHFMVYFLCTLSTRYI